jgi:hypothetical protein
VDDVAYFIPTSPNMLVREANITCQLLKARLPKITSVNRMTAYVNVCEYHVKVSYM